MNVLVFDLKADHPTFSSIRRLAKDKPLRRFEVFLDDYPNPFAEIEFVRAIWKQFLPANPPNEESNNA